MFRTSIRKLNLISKILRENPKFTVSCLQQKTSTGFPYYVVSASYSDVQNSRVGKPLEELIGKEKDGEDGKKPEDDGSKKKKESSWRMMKMTLAFFGVAFTSLGSYLVYTLGAPNVDRDGIPIPDDVSNKPVWLQYFIRTYRELHFYTKLIQEPSRHKLLPDPLEYPYLQPKYTLVLELTDVLVHPDWTYNTGWRFKKRPGLDYFLDSLHGVYEIVIYTAEQGMTLFPLCEAIDPKNIIAYKLPRDTTYFSGGHHVKSLDKLNRDLSKVICVDWNPKSVKFHPENLLQIKRWNGNDNDHTMIDLAAFLKSIADNEIEDVREVLQHFKGYDDPIEAFKEKRRRLIDKLEAEAAAKMEQDQSKVKKWTPSFFLKKPF